MEDNIQMLIIKKACLNKKDKKPTSKTITELLASLGMQVKPMLKRPTNICPRNGTQKIIKLIATLQTRNFTK
jgi:predicted transcriptional regulator